MKAQSKPRPEAIEIHLEELDAHSWLRAVPDTLIEPYGRGQYRFVVVARGAADHSLKDHLAVSVSFPALRLQDPEDAAQPDAWLDVARQRLADLHAELVSAGWRRKAGGGSFWWSWAYEDAREPAVDESLAEGAA